MKGHRCRTVLELLVLLCVVERAWSAGGGSKAFRLTVSSSDNSIVLCAVSEANQAISVSELSTSADRELPKQVRCARRCNDEAICHSFNYRSDNDSCQFYHYPPDVCRPVPSCQYYQVCLLRVLFALSYGML